MLEFGTVANFPAIAVGLAKSPMRQIGTLSSAVEAQRLADYLLTQGVTSRVLPETDGHSLWVCEEQHLERARAEFEQFRETPHDPRYQTAHALAQGIRREEARLQAQAQSNFISARSMWSLPTLRHAPLTLTLALASVVVSVVSNFGARFDTTLRPLTITAIDRVPPDRIEWDGLRDIEQGQWWRLVTPCLIHFDLLHLLFNLWWLMNLGRRIESLAGSFRYALLVLVIAAISNVTQYYYPVTLEWLRSPALENFDIHPLFGGMSGVVYGLFGFVWMKARHGRGGGYFIDDQSVFLMLLWLVVCTLGLVGPIANTAHLVGMLTGMAAGYGSAMLRRR